MTTFYYVLNGRTPVAVSDVLAWGEWFATADRQVARDADEATGVWLSTVFLGLDHQWGTGPPILFESLVFVPPTYRGPLARFDGHIKRYATWAEAERGHAAILARLRAAIAEA